MKMVLRGFDESSEQSESLRLADSLSFGDARQISQGLDR